MSPETVENTSYLSSPDTPSTVFPERLIRPLPKRSIKSRLSQEAADAITYPPTLPSTSLPTYAHYGENGDYPNDSKVLVQHHSDGYDHDHDHDHDEEHDHHGCPHHHHCHHDEYEDDLDSQDERMVPVRHYFVTSQRSPRSARQSRYAAKGGASVPDGYEAFENTNNKKKRKIPTSGSLSLHHSTMTNELAHMGISGSKDGSADDSYYATTHTGTSSGLGVQGAGRGRNTRKLPGRNPLGVSVNGSNARSGPSKYDQNMSANAKAEESKDQGIISAAIANATALLRKPLGKGQENVGVLDQQAKQAHTNSQFTFTCETEAKGVTFPEQSLYSPGYSQRNNLAPPAQSGSYQKASTQGTHTTPNVPPSSSQQPATAATPASTTNTNANANTNTNAQGKKPRRRRGDVYALAARQRKLQQEYSNLQHPPAPEDIWICEFCEYESIFGQAPRALIRQYEIKDRKERRRLAEKRRLLEKAKLKGRKGKKQAKNAAKAAKEAMGTLNPAYDNQGLDQLGDDDLDYGYDDEPISMPAPPAQTSNKQGSAGASNVNATTDKAGGAGAGGGTR
ncbi:uncharacterized protein Z518_00542 [Rhinocladiella mackenziei CBS 650.93]|uniref:Uncharacterized protein n=1 Tax=Rhinocladiella mackenziei CBS 650.93 TaxID=1442369 RepID=A0A0D2G482_9EURO|nr:uncharacterized protein Z518_00542 [Rhinocladiella mackenziei CBS 650.93]KIX09462.1 hypothetical protein Z518_00542 [Rhinocladiella mackenziei CBS 650.93]